MNNNKEQKTSTTHPALGVGVERVLYDPTTFSYGNVRLHHIDCMDFMREKPDGYYDLAIVDPQYGIGMDGGNVGYKGYNDFKKKEWDKEPPSLEYFIELNRVSNNQIIWGGNYFELHPSRCFIVWDKGEGFYNRTYAECEMAWTSFNANAKIYKRDPLANGDYKGKIHPTQKPIQLYKWLLQNYAKQGDKILDTHGGSFSSAIACYLEGFEFDGCEIDKDYYDAGVKRFNEITRQERLFT